MRRVIKQSKIRRKGAPAPRPSRIRRDPLLVQPVQKKAPPRSREREIWLGVTGVILFAVAIVTVTAGFSVITGHEDAAAASGARGQFGSCEGGPNCVIDGDTIRIAGSTVDIAGMDAPELASAQCQEETLRGVEAVQKLTTLLNSGTVTVGGDVTEPDGAVRKAVEVDGRDVGAAMVSAGAAREPSTGPHHWCPE